MARLSVSLTWKNTFGTLHVLKDVSLSVEEREVVCVIGRSGSGKSTLLRCINFLEQPTQGTIEVDGSHVEVAQHRLSQSAEGNHSPDCACAPAWSFKNSICFRI